ncbi:hypothetical protein O1611_g8417 [Lasiodiplodia mahajangana]|uniref:Uncharacterized protein n=1 Tax=Lasiodiplodia mahajangana TaxID=1108764 RepID=A0ACC2JCY1_9PEZI|nr:hypothetical protein O1611_g8417 [Lasiodiplodia mahajangana]
MEVMILKKVVSDARAHAAVLWDIELQDGCVHSIRPSDADANPETPPQLLLPPLCHPHVHLDKAYVLTCNNRASPEHPDYSDLCPSSGSFDEALINTSRAKERYTPDDLYLRGSQLLASSYAQGVTSMRAFVELDHVTGTLPLAIAIRLKKDFAHLLTLQICAFAQDPIFSTTHGDANRAIIEDALAEFAGSIGALGTTPYVETSREASLSNIEWAVTTALKHHLHLDFHLDYNLEPPSPSQKPLIYAVIDLLKQHSWAKVTSNSRTIVLGHCTRLSMLDDAERKLLAQAIIASKLPIHFVGLPTSDMFMMGRPNPDSRSSHNRPRGTIHVPSLVRELGLSACLGINNVGNAFTPYGTGDPLQMASWAVGIYQVGTVQDAKLLYECVSNRARQAIGLDAGAKCGLIREGQRLHGMLLLGNQRVVRLPGAHGQPSIAVPSRQRLTIKDIVWDPPEISLRSILR